MQLPSQRELLPGHAGAPFHGHEDPIQPYLSEISRSRVQNSDAGCSELRAEGGEGRSQEAVVSSWSGTGQAAFRRN